MKLNVLLVIGFIVSSESFQLTKLPKQGSVKFSSVSHASVPSSDEVTGLLSILKARSEHSSSTLSRALTQISEQSEQAALKIGILLLNLGGPEKLSEVEPFLFNLFSDPDIIRLPSALRFLQVPIAKAISSNRAPKSTKAYQSIGGGSPILRWTNAQASALEATLADLGLKDTRSYVAMRYWHPYTEAAIEEMHRDGINTVVVLPLYPQYSISTTESSLREYQSMLRLNPLFAERTTTTVIPQWHTRPGFINSVAKRIVKEVKSIPAADRESGVTCLYSAHGVPKSYVEKEGDPYQQQVIECAKLITERVSSELAKDPSIGNVRFELSYQSRVGPVTWLTPYTDYSIEKLGTEGVKNLVMVPISFVSEHIETLEEMDLEYKALAIESGIQQWRRVGAPNTDPSFITELALLVLEALAMPVVSIADALSLHAPLKPQKAKNQCIVPPRMPTPAAAKQKQHARRPQTAPKKTSSTTHEAMADNSFICMQQGSSSTLAHRRIATHNLMLVTERVASLGCLLFMLDGCAREIFENSQLPIIVTF